jgi:hypothetical protein
MKLYSQKDKQILRALELMVNATNNEEAINFLKLFSIT